MNKWSPNTKYTQTTSLRMYDLTPPHLRTVVFRQGWKAEVVAQWGGGFRVVRAW